MKYDQTKHPVMSFTEEELLKALGARGGHVIGQTRSGKPIYANSNHPSHASFNPHDHYDAKAMHQHGMATQGKSTSRRIAQDDHDSQIPSSHPMGSKTANTHEALMEHAKKLSKKH